jgi:FAD/FMN-containing dehydrogenase
VAGLRGLAESVGGSLTIWDCDAAWRREIPTFGAARSAGGLLARVKDAFDPQNLLSRGRFDELFGHGRAAGNR